VLAVYWPVLGFDFVSYDDSLYVARNPHVQRGLGIESLRWAWTTLYAANWQPLAWMSHMADWELYGPLPAGHHATSVLFHAANTVLLFVLLDRATGSPWRSALVAALFALHPLRVESVAWVSERKDVLSAFFWFLTLLAYVRYVRAPSVAAYAVVAIGLVLGLATKPMVVTLPLTLLLLDYWPLGRLGGAARAADAWRLVREKFPLLVLVTAASALTIVAQRRAGAMGPLSEHPFGVRIGNAVVSYVSYLGKTFWPQSLSILYPHPGATLPMWEIAASAAVLLVVTALALRERDRRPYLVVGWLWYLVTLAPVIGLIQAGEQGMADRFTYVPLVGIFVATVWLLPSPRGALARLAPALAVAALLALAARTSQQLPAWRDSTTLYTHALAVNEANPTAHANLGAELVRQGRTDEARVHFERCIELSARCTTGRDNLGALLLDEGRVDEAVTRFEESLRIDADSAEAHEGLGQALARLGRSTEAEAHYREALRLEPDRFGAHFNLAVLLAEDGRAADAVAHWQEAVRIRPDHADAHYGLGNALARVGRDEEAVDAYRAALRIDPDAFAAHFNLGNSLSRLGRRDEAEQHYAEAVRLNPDLAARRPARR
jgi:tetratricopeptide (TPR) repeat protein